MTLPLPVVADTRWGGAYTRALVGLLDRRGATLEWALEESVRFGKAALGLADASLSRGFEAHVPPAHTRALLLGNARHPSGEELPGVAWDLSCFGEALRRLGVLGLLVQHDLSAAAMAACIVREIDAAPPGTRVLIYYSGRGERGVFLGADGQRVDLRAHGLPPAFAAATARGVDVVVVMDIAEWASSATTPLEPLAPDGVRLVGAVYPRRSAPRPASRSAARVSQGGRRPRGLSA